MQTLLSKYSTIVSVVVGTSSQSFGISFEKDSLHCHITKNILKKIYPDTTNCVLHCVCVCRVCGVISTTLHLVDFMQFVITTKQILLSAALPFTILLALFLFPVVMITTAELLFLISFASQQLHYYGQIQILCMKFFWECLQLFPLRSIILTNYFQL